MSKKSSRKSLKGETQQSLSELKIKFKFHSVFEVFKSIFIFIFFCTNTHLQLMFYFSYVQIKFQNQ